jgi:threonine synthase
MSVMETLARKGSAPDSALQISAFLHSPVGMAGVKTISYELAGQINDELKHVFSPAGGGGLTLAVARGFEDLPRTNQTQCRPAVHCAQPHGNDTIASPRSNSRECGARRARRDWLQTVLGQEMWQ